MDCQSIYHLLVGFWTKYSMLRTSVNKCKTWSNGESDEVSQGIFTFRKDAGREDGKGESVLGLLLDRFEGKVITYH